MISARDEFFLEREMIYELRREIFSASLHPEHKYEMLQKLEGEVTAEEFEAMKLEIFDKQLRPLDKMRQGKALKEKQASKAAQQFANEPNS